MWTGFPAASPGEDRSTFLPSEEGKPDRDSGVTDRAFERRPDLCDPALQSPDLGTRGKSTQRGLPAVPGRPWKQGGTRCFCRFERAPISLGPLYAPSHQGTRFRSKTGESPPETTEVGAPYGQRSVGPPPQARAEEPPPWKTDPSPTASPAPATPRDWLAYAPDP